MISGLSLRLRWARPGTRHQATHPLRQSHEWEILEREVREALLNLKALSFDAPSPKGPTNYQLTTVGWLPLNVVAARGQNTFVSTIKNLDFKHFYFYSCDYCVWCGRLILSPNVQIYPRIKQHLRPIMPGPGLELQRSIGFHNHRQVPFPGAVYSFLVHSHFRHY